MAETRPRCVAPRLLPAGALEGDLGQGCSGFASVTALGCSAQPLPGGQPAGPARACRMTSES